MNPTKRERIASLTKERDNLMLKLETAELALAMRIAGQTSWQPIATAPENKPILVKYARDTNEIGKVHVEIKKEIWWYKGGMEGRHLEKPVSWRDIPE
jgi:hypothetical protein